MKAYPIMYKHPTTGLIVEHEGMELRDWFAGMAMLGMLSENSGVRYPTDELVEFAYKVSDAMMKQREVKNV
jgi:hypothetical protein